MKITKEVKEAVLNRIMAGESLLAICKDKDMPSRSSIFHIINRDEKFADQYERAMFIRAMGYVDELVDIADDGRNDWMETNDPENPGYRFNKEHCQRSKIRVETRKWIAAKMLPRFSDRYDPSKAVDNTADPVKVEIIVNDASRAESKD